MKLEYDIYWNSTMDYNKKIKSEIKADLEISYIMGEKQAKPIFCKPVYH